MKDRKLILVAVVALVAFSAIAWLAVPGPREDPTKVAATEGDGEDPPGKPRVKTLPGINGDAPASAPETNAATAEMEAPVARLRVARFSAKDFNGSFRSEEVIAQHPERLTPMMAPPPFDPEVYQRAPDAYLNTIEPGRVFQSARPGPNVPVITSTGGFSVRVREGEAVRLSVKVPPGDPITMTSYGGGAFKKTGLPTVSVAANDQGLAETVFVADRVGPDSVHILAAGPTASGRVDFYVDVQRPVENPAPPEGSSG